MLLYTSDIKQFIDQKKNDKAKYQRLDPVKVNVFGIRETVDNIDLVPVKKL